MTNVDAHHGLNPDQAQASEPSRTTAAELVMPCHPSRCRQTRHRYKRSPLSRVKLSEPFPGYRLDRQT